ncbi:MAG TPA: histidine phosphatase family protein, partial [Fervidobacterium sp.]|nr:histidine phosphatase family protein [Fervidobacterium sp.]
LNSNIAGVESLESVQKRMYDLLRDVIVHFTNKNVIIVSHAIAMRMLISKVLNLIPPDHLNFVLDNASVSSLISNDGKIKVNFLNYTSNL